MAEETKAPEAVKIKVKFNGKDRELAATGVGLSGPFAKGTRKQLGLPAGELSLVSRGSALGVPKEQDVVRFYEGDSASWADAKAAAKE